MVRLQVFALVMAVAGLAGCGVVDTAARNSAPFAGLDVSDAIESMESALRAPRAGYVVTDVRIDVPRDLRVSEANVYYPFADIVWRGDPYGDRYAQVEQIFRDAFADAVPVLSGGPQVVADVEVYRFHALTEKARYTIGGVHSVRFYLTLRDTVTGEVLDGPRQIKADMRASGGAKTLAEDAIGYTQRVALTRHLADVLSDELALRGAVADTRKPDADTGVDQPAAVSTGNPVRAEMPITSARAAMRPRDMPVK